MHLDLAGPPVSVRAPALLAAASVAFAARAALPEERKCLTGAEVLACDGGPCLGSETEKTLFIDLGNEKDRDDLTHDPWRLPDPAKDPQALFGGTMTTGDWVVLDSHGCESDVAENDSVRIVLLQPNPDVHYGLIMDNGIQSPSVVEPNEADGGAVDLGLPAASTPSCTPRSKPESLGCRCPAVLASAETGDAGELCGCEQWKEKCDGQLERVSDALDLVEVDGGETDGSSATQEWRFTRWAERTAFDLSNYRGIRELLERMGSEQAEWREIAETDGGTWTGRAWFGRLAAAYSARRAWESAGCGLDAKGSITTFEDALVAKARDRSAVEGLVRALNALPTIERAEHMLHHAQEARVFGIRPLPGDSDVTLNIIAALRPDASQQRHAQKESDKLKQEAVARRAIANREGQKALAADHEAVVADREAQQDCHAAHAALAKVMAEPSRSKASVAGVIARRVEALERLPELRAQEASAKKAAEMQVSPAELDAVGLGIEAARNPSDAAEGKAASDAMSQAIEAAREAWKATTAEQVRQRVTGRVAALRRLERAKNRVQEAGATAKEPLQSLSEERAAKARLDASGKPSDSDARTAAEVAMAQAELASIQPSESARERDLVEQVRKRVAGRVAEFDGLSAEIAAMHPLESPAEERAARTELEAKVRPLDSSASAAADAALAEAELTALKPSASESEREQMDLVRKRIVGRTVALQGLRAANAELRAAKAALPLTSAVEEQAAQAEAKAKRRPSDFEASAAAGAAIKKAIKAALADSGAGIEERVRSQVRSRVAATLRLERIRASIAAIGVGLLPSNVDEDAARKLAEANESAADAASKKAAADQADQARRSAEKDATAAEASAEAAQRASVNPSTAPDSAPAAGTSVPYQLGFHVYSRQLLSLSVGFPEGWQPGTRPFEVGSGFSGPLSVFVGSHFEWMEDDRLAWLPGDPDCGACFLGLGVGLPISEFGEALLQGKLPFSVLVGVQVWLTPQIMLTAGPAFFPGAQTQGLVSWFGAVGFDAIALYRLIERSEKILPH